VGDQTSLSGGLSGQLDTQIFPPEPRSVGSPLGSVRRSGPSLRWRQVVAPQAGTSGRHLRPAPQAVASEAWASVTVASQAGISGRRLRPASQAVASEAWASVTVASQAVASVTSFWSSRRSTFSMAVRGKLSTTIICSGIL
jgi:hypothetical protein